MAWTRKKKVLTRLALWLAAVAAVIFLIAFTIARSFAPWQCLPRQVSSLAEIPTVGRSLSAWQTTGPVYYRYRHGFGDGCFVIVAGTTSAEAITVFQAVGHDGHDRAGTTPKRITEAVRALSSVPGFAFRQSEDNLSFCWDVGGETAYVSFDPRSGWFVAEITSSDSWDMNQPSAKVVP